MSKWRIVWRFFTGNHLDGKPRTNATWSKAGTLPRHKVTWWNALPRRKRMLIRHAWFWTSVVWSYGMVAHTGFTIFASLAGIPYLTEWIVRKIVNRIVWKVRTHTKTKRVKVNAVAVEAPMPEEEVREVIDNIGAEEDNVTEIPTPHINWRQAK